MNLTANPTLMAIILVVALLVTYELTRFFTRVLIESIQIIKDIRRNNAKYKNKLVSVKKMKAAGDFHDWITLPVGTKTLNVCRKTGYCPSNDSFISTLYIKQFEESQKREEEYVEFKQEKMKQLSEKYGIILEEMEQLADKVFEIKKEFTIKKLADLQTELDIDAKEEKGDEK